MCGVSLEKAWPNTVGFAALSCAGRPAACSGTSAGKGFDRRGTRDGEKSSGFVSTL